MSIAFLEQRVAELTVAVEKTFAAHNAMLGQLREATGLLNTFREAASKATESITEVSTPVMEAAVAPVEDVAEIA